MPLSASAACRYLSATQATTLVPLRLTLPQAGTFTLEAAALGNLAEHGRGPARCRAPADIGSNLHRQPRYSFTAAAGVARRAGSALQLGAAGTLLHSGGRFGRRCGLLPQPRPRKRSHDVSIPAVAGATDRGKPPCWMQPGPGRCMQQHGRYHRCWHAVSCCPPPRLPPGVYTVRLQIGAAGADDKRLVVE